MTHKIIRILAVFLLLVVAALVIYGYLAPIQQTTVTQTVEFEPLKN